MTSAAIKAITYKNLFLFKRITLVYLIAGIGSISLNFIPNKTSIIINSFIILTFFMTFYCHLAVKATMLEAKDKNWQFLMSLPLTPRFLFLSTLGTNWFLFFILWVVYLAGLALTILLSNHIPSMVFSLYFLIFVLYPPAFAIILATGLIFKRESATILAFVLCNSLTTAFISLISNSSEIQSGFPMGTFTEVGWLWPSWTTNMILACFGIFFITTSLTALVGWQRKNYV